MDTPMTEAVAECYYRINDRILPPTPAALRQKLSQKAENFQSNAFRESRMREICMSGSTRGRAVSGHWLCLSSRGPLSTLLVECIVFHAVRKNEMNRSG